MFTKHGRGDIVYKEALRKLEHQEILSQINL